MHRVVTSNVFGKITSEGHRPDASGCPRVRRNVRVGRPPADGQSIWRTIGAEGPRQMASAEWPVQRQTAQPPYSKTARNIDFHSLNSFIGIQVPEL
jgi:hypothetical protein